MNWHRVAVSVLALVAVVISIVQASVVMGLGTEYPISSVDRYTPFAAAMAAAALAVILSKAVGRPDGKAASLMLGFMAVNLSLIVVPSGSPSVLREVIFSISYLWVVLFVRFTMVFPREISLRELETLARRPRGMSATVRLTDMVVGAQRFVLSHPSTIVWMGALMLVVVYVTTSQFASRYYLVTTDVSEPFMLLVGVPSLLVLLALASSFLWTGYRLAGARERQKILWVVLSSMLVALWVTLGVLAYIFASWGGGLPRVVARPFWIAFYPVTFFLPLAGMATGILYSGAFDVRPIINRTTVYGALLLILTFLFAAVEELVESQLIDRLGVPDGIGTLMGAAAIAVAMGPLRTKLESLVKGPREADSRAGKQP